MNANPTTAPFSRRITAALLSGLTVAVVAYLVSVLAFFVAGQGATSSLAGLHGFFIWTALFAFLFSVVLALVGGFTRWYTAVASGVVAGALGSLIGSSLHATEGGHPFDGEVAQYALQTLIGPNLVFIIALVVATVTLGATVWSRLARGRNGGTTRQIALVRVPSDRLADGELTHLERVPVDIDLANSQWDEYVTTLANHGWDIREVPAANEFADSVFIEDTVVMFGKTAVLTSPGAESRRGEIEAVEKAVRRLGQRVERIVSPGTLDRGDVLKVGKTVYVGRGGRT
ncbi:MAG: dimethylarginine dimethylaminohydrolase, partial [Lacisediminihabitans sp.]